MKVLRDSHSEPEVVTADAVLSASGETLLLTSVWGAPISEVVKHVTARGLQEATRIARWRDRERGAAYALLADIGVQWHPLKILTLEESVAFLTACGVYDALVPGGEYLSALFLARCVWRRLDGRVKSKSCVYLARLLRRRLGWGLFVGPNTLPLGLRLAVRELHPPQITAVVRR